MTRCVNCGWEWIEVTRMTESGLCPDCDMLAEKLADFGFRRLSIYLARHAAFADWCATHPETKAA